MAEANPKPENPVPEPPAPQTPAPARSGWVAPTALVLALVAVLGILALGWQGYTQMRSLEIQLALRIGEFDAASREARGAAKAANEALADLQNRLMAMEARSQETQSQQLALSAMYQELADSADERVLADMEQTLLLARQQLLLAGNVRAALIGLEAADARLANLGKSQFSELHQAIVQDMERLKLMPAADIDHVNARLEALIQGVDKLKLESETEPALPRTNTDSGTLGAFGREAWKEIKSMLRIRRLDHPELPLLTPSQSYFLGQNLKLRLLAARLALLQRDEAGFRADLATAKSWVEHYFNRLDPATQAFLDSLASLVQAPVTLKDVQSLSSLTVLQNLRGGRQ